MALVENYSGVHSIDFVDNGVYKNTWRDFHLVPMKRPEIQEAAVNIQSVNIPDTDKRIDLVSYLEEGVTRDVVTGTWEFAIDHEQWSSWSEAYQALASAINGKRMTIMLDDGTMYGYSGRLRVSGYSPGNNWSTVTIEYQLDGGRYVVGRLIHKHITENGVYEAQNEGVEGYSGVTVMVHGEAQLKTKTITRNGTYNAGAEAYDGYSSVTVNVQPTLQTKTITENGDYTHDSGYDGLNRVIVNVPTGGGGGGGGGGEINLQAKTATQNGEVLPDSGYDGLSQVTVNVQPPLQTKDVIYNSEVIPDEGYYGLEKVTVNVNPPLQYKYVTENGPVEADLGYYGLSLVTVEVEGADPRPGQQGTYKPEDNVVKENTTVSLISIAGGSGIDMTPIITIENYVEGT